MSRERQFTCNRRAQGAAWPPGRGAIDSPRRVRQLASTCRVRSTLDEELNHRLTAWTRPLVDGPRDRTISRWAAKPLPLSETLLPMLAPCVRNRMDYEGLNPFFCLPFARALFETATALAP